MYSPRSFLVDSDGGDTTNQTFVDDFSALSLSNGNGTNGRNFSEIYSEDYGNEDEYYDAHYGVCGQSKFTVDKRVLGVIGAVAALGVAAYTIFQSSTDGLFYLLNLVWSILSKLKPLFWGVVMAAFSWSIVYFDSDVPGLLPPSPFLRRSKQSHQEQRTASLHIAYMTALASGIVVTLIMMFSDFP